MYFKALIVVIFSVWWRPFCDCFNNGADLKCERIALEQFQLPSRIEPDNNQITLNRKSFNLNHVNDVVINNASKVTLVTNKTEENFDSFFSNLHYIGKDKSALGAFDQNGSFYGTFVHLGELQFVEADPCFDQKYQVFRCSKQFRNRNVSPDSCELNATEEEDPKMVRPQPAWTHLLRMAVGDFARSSRRGKQDKKKEEEFVVCDLKIVADFPFFSRVANFSKDEALKIILDVISRVDEIFRKSDFDRNRVPDNLRFFISDIKVFLEPIGDESNYTAEWNPSTFFSELIYRYDFSGACAGLLFTYREFPGNETFSPAVFKSTLGSSDQGIGSSANDTQWRVPLEEEANYGAYISNAVPVNFRWREKEEPCRDAKLMAVHTAHQLAQLFGAPTDDDTVCNTSDPRQMNVMAFPLPPADYPENFKFSSCSNVAIYDYLSNVSRKCLRVCEGSKCIKRSMKFPVDPHDVTEKNLPMSTIPAVDRSAADALELSKLNIFVVFSILASLKAYHENVPIFAIMNVFV